MEKNLYKNTNDIIRTLQNSPGGTMGIVLESPSAEYHASQSCDLYTIGSLATRFYGFAFPKDKSTYSRRNLVMPIFVFS